MSQLMLVCIKKLFFAFLHLYIKIKIALYESRTKKYQIPSWYYYQKCLNLFSELFSLQACKFPLIFSLLHLNSNTLVSLGFAGNRLPVVPYFLLLKFSENLVELNLSGNSILWVGSTWHNGFPKMSNLKKLKMQVGSGYCMNAVWQSGLRFFLNNFPGQFNFTNYFWCLQQFAILEIPGSQG